MFVGTIHSYCFHLLQDHVRSILLRHADTNAGLSFKILNASSATAWKSCVPLTSLRTVATKIEQQQQLLADESWIADLIQWDNQPDFASGMFVAKVHGDAMAPEIPAGSYCLFRLSEDHDHFGKILFIRHLGVSDPHTGGNWTVRRAEKGEQVEGTEGWSRDCVVLAPENKEYPPITLGVKSIDDLRVLRELVLVLA